MAVVPREIFELINPKNVALFKTCKMFFEYIDVFYRLYTVDIRTNPFIKLTNNFTVENIVKVPPNPRNLMHHNCVYKLANADEIPDGKFVNLTHISFNRDFNRCIDKLNNLSNIESILLGGRFHLRVDVLPKTLISLTFGNKFNQPLNNLPATLTSLTFGNSFNQTVDKLPETLKSLTFGYHFNRPVDNLPETLKSLTFGYSFNQAVDNLPQNLTSLTFGCEFPLR
jgi:hypothetical protein